MAAKQWTIIIRCVTLTSVFVPKTVSSSLSTRIHRIELHYSAINRVAVCKSRLVPLSVTICNAEIYIHVRINAFSICKIYTRDAR